MTVQGLIDLSCLDIRAEAAGDTMQQEEYADCITKLNQLIALWDTEYLNIFCVQENTYVLVGGQLTPYKLGTGGMAPVGGGASVRPVSIRAANIISSGFTWELRIIRVEEWAKIIEKGASGEPPEVLYYDANYPTALIYLNPWPSSADTLELFTWEQLGQFTGADTPTILALAFDMPPGYAEALEWNLAISLAEMFGRPVTQSLITKAAAAKASIRANNSPPGPGNAEVIQASGTAVPIPPDAGNAMTR